jgi:hypothetical protein
LWIALVVEADYRREEVEGCGWDTGKGYTAALPLRQLSDVKYRVVEVIQ